VFVKKIFLSISIIHSIIEQSDGSIKQVFILLRSNFAFSILTINMNFILNQEVNDLAIYRWAINS